jgi:hypothetical protein
VTAGAAKGVGLVRDGRTLPFAWTQPDPRVRAAVAVSGRLPWLAPSELRPLPLLVYDGKLDEIVERVGGLGVYRRAPPKALLTIEIPGQHEYVEDEPRTTADVVVADVAAAFLDRALHALSTPKPAVDPALGRLESDGVW